MCRTVNRLNRLGDNEVDIFSFADRVTTRISFKLKGSKKTVEIEDNLTTHYLSTQPICEFLIH